MSDQVYSPGVYRISVARLNIRGTPSTKHQGNLVGQQLTIGNVVQVFEIVPDLDGRGWIWGRINPVGPARYICLTDFHTVFANQEASHDIPTVPFDPPDKSNWLEGLYEWAKGQGYKGKGPRD